MEKRLLIQESKRLANCKYQIITQPYSTDEIFSYFVNWSGTALEWVRANPAGMLTCDDQAVALCGKTQSYHEIQSNEAVLVDRHPTVYGSDGCWQLSLYIKELNQEPMS